MASKEDLARKKLKVADNIFAAQNQCNEIIQTHSEMLLFSAPVVMREDSDVGEYLSTMRKRALTCVKALGNADEGLK